MRTFKLLFLGILALSATGVWGCGQQKTGVMNAKIRDLETRHTRLEEDFRTLSATNDLNRKRLAQAETQLASLDREKTEISKQFESAVLERDNLRKLLSQRTQERDSAQGNLQQFSKDLQALVGRVEAALNTDPQPSNTPILPASRRSE